MDGIRRWFTASGAQAPVPSHAGPVPIDVARLVDELDLRGEGARLGGLGVPAADAVVPTGPETAALQRIEKSRQDHVDWAVLRLSVIDQGLAACDATAEVNRARQADAEFVRRASAMLAERRPVLGPAADAARRCRDELLAFRTRHGLAREAQVIDFWGAAWRLAIVLFLAVFEGVLNAGFFAHGVDTGLLGGAFQAMSLALLNVGVAYALGRWGVRWVHHASPPLRAIGVASIAFAAVAMSVIALGIAHVRDALAADLPHAAEAALQALQSRPFTLHDPMSWGLCAISLAFGAVALVDGHTSDDAYPGYGAVAARERQAREDLDDELDALREDLEALKDETLRHLDEVVRRAQATVVAAASYLRDREAATSRLRTALRDADHALAAVLAAFRSENEAHRGDAPRPAYFDRPASLAPLALPDLDAARHEQALAAQRALVDALLAEVEGVRARVQSAYLRAADDMKPLDAHFGAEAAPGGTPAEAA